MARGEIGDRAGDELCAGDRSAGARRHPELGRISAYAQGGDYHKTVKKALKALARFIVDEAPTELKVFVDTAPVMEKPLAAAAGIGWQGKHTNLVSREHGNWLFLGIILTSLELEPDAPRRGSIAAAARAASTPARRGASTAPTGSMRGAAFPI